MVRCWERDAYALWLSSHGGDMIIFVPGSSQGTSTLSRISEMISSAVMLLASASYVRPMR